MKVNWLATASVVAPLLLMAACGGGSSDGDDGDALLREAARLAQHEPDSHAGVVEGGAYVGVLNLRGQVLAYVCDGVDGRVSVSRWFRGTLVDGRLEAVHEDGSRLAGTLDGTSLRGVLQADGQARAFTAPAVTRPAGLWLGIGQLDDVFAARADPASLHRVGWIVLGDGSRRGAANTAAGAVAAGALDTTSGDNGHGSRAVNAEPLPPAGTPQVIASWSGDARALGGPPRRERALAYFQGRIISDECAHFGSAYDYAVNQSRGAAYPLKFWAVTGWAVHCHGAYGSLAAFF